MREQRQQSERLKSCQRSLRSKWDVPWTCAVIEFSREGAFIAS